MRSFKTGATRDTNQKKLNFKGFFSPQVKHADAVYMDKHRLQADGTLRDADNWKAGMPIDVYAESLMRHVEELHLLYETTNDKEQVVDKLCAIRFNASGWMHELLTAKPQLNCRPGQWLPETDVGKWNIGTNGWSYNSSTDLSQQWPNPED